MSGATNTTLGELPVGCIVRSHHRAPSTWRIDGGENGRVLLHNLVDVSRECDASASMSVWLVGEGDLTLRCPVCGKRADMCFAHGDDWKKR